MISPEIFRRSFPGERHDHAEVPVFGASPKCVFTFSLQETAPVAERRRKSEKNCGPMRVHGLAHWHCAQHGTIPVYAESLCGC
jgi:hypothetical protein